MLYFDYAADTPGPAASEMPARQPEKMTQELDNIGVFLMDRAFKPDGALAMTTQVSVTLLE